MKIEGVPRHTVELHETALGIATEAPNAIDVDGATGKLILTVVNPQMFVKANIDQPVIAMLKIRVDDAGNIALAPNDGLQRTFGGIRHG